MTPSQASPASIVGAATGSPLEETITLRQAKALIRCMAHEQSFLLLSPPGVGKSEMVHQAAAEAGLPCRSLLGTQIAPEDVSGIPRIVGERSVFCPPRILLPENPEPFCLFLDELPACAADVQKAFAYDVGLSLSAVNNYLNGRVPATEVLFRIARYTGRPMEWFLVDETPVTETLPLGPELGAPTAYAAASAGRGGT